MPDPCGVPTPTGSHRPLSRIPALSHRSIKRRTRRSAILCLNIRTNQPWSMASKKVRMSRSSTQFTRRVISAFSRRKTECALPPGRKPWLKPTKSASMEARAQVRLAASHAVGSAVQAVDLIYIGSGGEFDVCRLSTGARFPRRARHDPTHRVRGPKRGRRLHEYSAGEAVWFEPGLRARASG